MSENRKVLLLRIAGTFGFTVLGFVTVHFGGVVGAAVVGFAMLMTELVFIGAKQ